MLWSRFLRREASRTHQLIGASEVDLFPKLVLNPRLHLLAVPNDPLLEVFLQACRQSLLLAGSENTGGTPVVSPTILQARQPQIVIPLDDQMCGWNGVFRDFENVTERVAFGQERKKLRSSSFDSACTGTVKHPEVVSLMLELNRERCPGDASI